MIDSVSFLLDNIFIRSSNDSIHREVAGIPVGTIVLLFKITELFLTGHEAKLRKKRLKISYQLFSSSNIILWLSNTCT